MLTSSALDVLYTTGEVKLTLVPDIEAVTAVPCELFPSSLYAITTTLASLSKAEENSDAVALSKVDADPKLILVPDTVPTIALPCSESPTST